jgi:hypothetical protein
LYEKAEAGKHQKIDDFLKKSFPADPPNTYSDISSPALMAINTILDTADLFINSIPFSTTTATFFIITPCNLVTPLVHLASHLAWYQ